MPRVVRCHEHIGHVPKRRLRRKRLCLKDIQPRATDPPFAEGLDQRLQQTTDEDITIARVVISFQSYAICDPSWRRGYEWEEMDVGGEPVEKEGCLGLVIFAITGAGFVVGAIALGGS